MKLVEKYENEQPFSDGDILWRIRHYFHSKDKSRENIWWARLTPAKQRDVKQLLKNDKFAAAFDNLLDKPGLWTGIQLGTLHRFLTLRCDEVCLKIYFYINIILIIAGNNTISREYFSSMERNT